MPRPKKLRVRLSVAFDKAISKAIDESSVATLATIAGFPRYGHLARCRFQRPFANSAKTRARLERLAEFVGVEGPLFVRIPREKKS